MPKPASPQELAARIAQIRKQLGLTQEQFLSRLPEGDARPTLKTLYSYESGKVGVRDVYFLHAVAELSGTPFDVLLGLASDPRAEVLSTFVSRVKTGGGSKILSKKTGVPALELEACVKGQPSLAPSSVAKLAPVLEMDERELALLRQDWKPAGAPATGTAGGDAPAWARELDRKMDEVKALLTADRESGRK